MSTSLFFTMALVKRDATSTKGKNGRILVLGGSRVYSGAPILSAQSALRSGADLSLLYVPYAVNRRVVDPQLVSKAFHNPLSGYYSRSFVGEALRLAKDVDCVLLGPGMSTRQCVKSFIHSFVLNVSVPVVLDADALKIVDLSCLKGKRCVLTPHAQEFREMVGQEPTQQNVMKQAQESRVILLKGQTDSISDGKRLQKNTNGNAGLSVGGTGDILAGVVASLIAQGNSLFDASYYAAKIIGECGDTLYKSMGYNYTPSDILAVLPSIVKKYNS